MDHKQFLVGLDDDERNLLNTRTDRHAILHLGLYLGPMVVLATIIFVQTDFWYLAMPPLGILLIFLFTLQHETTHDTAFATPACNVVVRAVCGFLLLNPPLWFRYFHFAHHRHTHDPDRDPELAGGKPKTKWLYVWHLSGIPIWIFQVKVLVRNASAMAGDPFVPEIAKSRVANEARIFLFLYSLLFVGSIMASTTALLYLWVIPALFGQPFLRLYLMAEHGRCPHVANMFENTRTTFTNRIVRFLAWNMPYHAAPTVPFHKLNALHLLTQEYLKTTENGYYRFHRKYQEEVL